jgi:hypothetical protein
VHQGRVRRPTTRRRVGSLPMAEFAFRVPSEAHDAGPSIIGAKTFDLVYLQPRHDQAILRLTVFPSDVVRRRSVVESPGFWAAAISCSRYLRDLKETGAVVVAEVMNLPVDVDEIVAFLEGPDPRRHDPEPGSYVATWSLQ